MSRVASSSRGDAPASEKLRFRVDANLLLQLGEQLVSDRTTAIAELVKNAYDADATRVTVRFANVSKAGGAIVIEDNGRGMSLDDIRTHWMTIGTVHKVRAPHSLTYGRTRAGNKGTGRFAARRLARVLTLRSVAKADPKHTVVVSFDWSEFEAGKGIEETAAIARVVAREADHSGITLELKDVRDSWAADDIRHLRQHLLALIVEPDHRSQAKRDPGLTIEVDAPEFPEVAGRLGEELRESAYARLKGRLSGSEASYSLTFLKGPNRGKRHEFQISDAKFKRVATARFTIDYVRYASDDFSAVGLPIALARELGQRLGGVRVYLDGFRVPAYGGETDDWLDLDRDRGRRQTKTPAELLKFAGTLRRPLLSLPGNNNLLGRVHLERQKSRSITQTLDRERLIEDDSFDAVKRFVRIGIDWMTVVYAREKLDRRPAPSKPRTSAAALMRSARELIQQSADDLGPAAPQLQQALKLAEDAAESEEQRHISELSLLRVLASAGTTVQVFSHQLQHLMDGLRRAYAGLKAHLNYLPSARRKDFGRDLTDLETWIESAEHQGRLLGLLQGAEARSRRRRIALLPHLRTLKRAFGNYFEEYSIDFSIEGVAADHRTPPMYEAELGAILANLLTNAIKAVRPVASRRILVRSYRKPELLRIHVLDSGVGVDLSRADEYFQAFVSESAPDPVLGTGTGLGLKIVRDLAELYDGAARFLDPPTPWKTCIEVRFREDAQ